MNKFRSYPTISNKLINKIKYNYTDPFLFKYNNATHLSEDSIKVNSKDQVIDFKDENNRWFYKRNDLIILKKIAFKTKFFFGDKGVTPHGSTLGVAISWKSRHSKRRGVVQVGYFDDNSNEFLSEGRLYFEEKDIRNKLDIEVIIYLKKFSGIISKKDSFFATEEGTILGVLESKTINFVGQGSLFPISVSQIKDDPLWKLHIKGFDYDKPVEDNVTLVINQNHKKFHLFDNSEKYNSDFVEEVMINVVYQLLLTSNEYDMYYSEYPEGSLGQLINYYKRVYNLEEINPTELYSTISKVIRK